MNENAKCGVLLELLVRWQAFSELQQRAFEFLAREALGAGQEFESSTDGATRVLTRMNDTTQHATADEVKAETWAVVHRLQAADRSRQGLEQVASVLNTLRQQHADLVAATHAATELPDVDTMMERWIAALAENVNLADWRRRLIDALHGRASVEAEACCDEELF